MAWFTQQTAKRYSLVEKLPVPVCFCCTGTLLTLCIRQRNVILYGGDEQFIKCRASHINPLPSIPLPLCKTLKITLRTYTDAGSEWIQLQLFTVHEKLKNLREAKQIGNYTDHWVKVHMLQSSSHQWVFLKQTATFPAVQETFFFSHVMRSDMKWLCIVIKMCQLKALEIMKDIWIQDFITSWGWLQIF